MILRQAQLAGLGVLLGSWCGLLVGCGHGGIVRGVIPSEDGRVLLYHSENAGEGTYVADRRGAEKIGGDGSAFLSKDGRYVLLVGSRPNGPRWPGNGLELYDVARRTSRTAGPVSAKLYNPQSLRAKDGWEPNLAEVYFEPGPAVVMGVNMAKFNESPAKVTEPRYVRWRPGKGFTAVAQLSGTKGLNTEQQTDAEDSWVLVRQPNGRQPFRTVWVHPDGEVVELLRSNQSFGATSFMVLIFPFTFWSPGYYRMGSWLTESKRANPQALQAEEPRLQKLIAARKAQAGQRREDR